MKKLLVALISVAFCFSAVALTGCDDSGMIKESLVDELESIKTLDGATVDELSSALGGTSLETLGIDAEEFIKAVLDGFDYEVGDVKIDGDTATVQMTLTVKDFSDFSADMQKLATNFDVTKYDSVDAAKKAIGKKAMEMIEDLDAVTSDPIDVTYTLEDKTWSMDNDVALAITRAMGLA